MGNEQWSPVSHCCLFIYLLWPSVIIRITLAAGGLCHFIVNRCSFALDEMTNVSVLPRGAVSETVSTKNLQYILESHSVSCFFFREKEKKTLRYKTEITDLLYSHRALSHCIPYWDGEQFADNGRVELDLLVTVWNIQLTVSNGRQMAWYVRLPTYCMRHNLWYQRHYCLTFRFTQRRCFSFSSCFSGWD